MVGLTENYCVDFLDVEGLGGWVPTKIYAYYSIWVTLTLSCMLLFRLRFKHCVVVVVLPGLVHMILTVQFAVGTGAFTPSVMAFTFVITYVPGVAVCIATPYAAEMSQYANYLMHRAKDEDLAFQASTIARQKVVIRRTTTQALQAQQRIDACIEEGGTVLEQMSLVMRDLTVWGQIGEGSFGIVYRGMLRGQTPVAIKNIRVGKITKKTLFKFRAEILTMAPLKHDNLVRLLGAVYKDGPDHLYLVLEFVEGGDLYCALQRFPGTWANPRSGIALGIASCFQYLHHGLARPLMHRDLKPMNVLVDRHGRAKVADFGEAKVVECEAPATRVGTTYYAAPELLLGKVYNESVDTYAFGLVLLEVALGNPNYTRDSSIKNNQDHVSAVVNGWRPPIPAWVQDQMPIVEDAVTSAWEHCPKERPNFNALVALLECELLQCV